MVRLAMPPSPPGRVALYSAYKPQFVDLLKGVPGCSWDPDKKCWWVPVECASALSQAGAKFRASPRFEILAPVLRRSPVRGDGLHPYQIEGAELANQSEHGYLLSWDMGLGKSAGALRATEGMRTAILTPAAVLPQWETQVQRWLGDTALSQYHEVDAKSTEEQIDASFIAAASYNRAEKLLSGAPFDALICDEAHYLKNPASQRSKVLTAVRERNPKLKVVLLSGTFIPKDAADLWNPLSLVWPGRWGSQYQFRRRYCESVEDKYATSKRRYFGLSEAYAGELRGRLASVCHRVTRFDVKDLLPPIQVVGLYHKASRDVLAAASQGLRQRDTAALEASIQLAAPAKQQLALERVEDHLETASHVCVLTYLKSTAESFAKLMRAAQPDVEVAVITGDLPIEDRNRVILHLKSQPRSVLVATQHSIGTGLDTLTFYTRVLFLELYYSPVIVLQALGRFSRLSSTEPAYVELLIFKATHDEIVARAVTTKLDIAANLLGAGGAEASLSEALSGDKENGLEDLFEAAMSMEF